jgi:predicted nucleic acid-binding protein
MLPSPYRVLLDANVLYPFTLRDTLLRAAASGLFQACWSHEILEETTRNLIAAGLMTEAQAKHLVGAMARAFPEALVTGYEHHIASMKNDPKDRHVAAAAVQAKASVIVTFNLRDFRILPTKLLARSPDVFLCELLEHDAATLLSLIHAQAAALKRPPRTFEDIVGGLATVVPRFAAAVRSKSGEAGG